MIWELIFNRPDIIHASSPGVLVCTAIFFARILRIPLVVSYHTHIPEYIPRYNLWTGLVTPHAPRRPPFSSGKTNDKKPASKLFK